MAKSLRQNLEEPLLRSHWKADTSLHHRLTVVPGHQFNTIFYYSFFYYYLMPRDILITP